MGMVFGLLLLLVQIYYYVIIVRVLLSWFQVDWYDQPYRALNDITEPFLGAFRQIIPPVGMMDFSPMVALLVLYVVRVMLAQMAAAV